MTQDLKPQDIAEQKALAGAEAALDQMFGYYRREGQNLRGIRENDAYALL